MYVGSISNLHVQVFICIFLSNATLLEGTTVICGCMLPCGEILLNPSASMPE